MKLAIDWIKLNQAWLHRIINKKWSQWKFVISYRIRHEIIEKPYNVIFIKCDNYITMKHVLRNHLFCQQNVVFQGQVVSNWKFYCHSGKTCLPIDCCFSSLLKSNYRYLCKHVGLVRSRHHYHLIKCNLFSPWYGWKIAHLVLNNNHSLTLLFRVLPSNVFFSEQTYGMVWCEKVKPDINNWRDWV